MAGRKTKRRADFFPHYANSDSMTKRILFQQLGHVGLCAWWELLEILTKADDHYFDARDPIYWYHLLEKLRVDDLKTGEIFFDWLVKLHQIDAELWKNRVVYCPNLVENLKPVYQKRAVEIPGKPYFRDGNLISGAGIEIPGQKSPCSRAEQSRAEKSNNNMGISGPEMNGTREPDAEGEKAAVAAGAAAAFSKDDFETAKTELIAEGVSPSVAKRLAESYPLQYILDHIDVVAAKVAKGGVKKPIAYLVKAIEENYEPPKDHITREERKRREQAKAEREKKKQAEQEQAKQKLKAEQAKYDDLQQRFEALPEDEQDRLHTHALKELEGNTLLWAAYQRNKEAGEADPLNMPTVRLSYLDAIAAEMNDEVPF